MLLELRARRLRIDLMRGKGVSAINLAFWMQGKKTGRVFTSNIGWTDLLSENFCYLAHWTFDRYHFEEPENKNSYCPIVPTGILAYWPSSFIAS